MSFVPILALGAGLILGAPAAGWAASLGFVLGFLVVRFLPVREFVPRLTRPLAGSEAVLVPGAFSLALLAGEFFRNPDLLARSIRTPSAWLSLLLSTLAFCLAHAALVTIDSRLDNNRWPKPRQIANLLLFELLPVPFVWIAVLAYPQVQIGTWIALGGIPLIFAVLIHRMGRDRSDLDRRVQELSTLHMVSEVLRSTLDLEKLLSVVHVQVSQILGVDNFYVALYTPEEDLIHYPLAVKHGKRLTWAPRPLSNRLTDQVIRQHKPILYSISAGKTEPDTDVQPSDESPTAWVGVPLVSSEQAIGCLALFSVTPGANFTPADLDLLLILSGPLSVAIENALLHGRTDQALTQRVQQLSILEAIGRELSAAIQSERLFEKILEYARQYTHSRWGSLALYNPADNLLQIKASFGYPQEHRSYPPQMGVSGQAYQTQRILIVGDITQHPAYIDFSDGEARSQISVPLQDEGRALGVLTLETDRLNGFSESDQAFIAQLATQASIAVVNAEMYREIQRRLREQSTLYLVSNSLSSQMDPESVLLILHRAVTAAVETAQVWTYLWQAGSRTYVCQPSSGSGEVERHASIPAQIAADQLPDGLSLPTPLQFEPGDNRLGLLSTGCPECRKLIFPLVVNQQRLGFVLIHTPAQDAPLNQEEQQLLISILTQCAISLQNALLFLDVTRGLDRLAAVLNSVREGMVMVEDNGQISLVNQSIQILTGLDPIDLADKHLQNLSDPVLRLLGYDRDQIQPLTQPFTSGQTPDSARFVYQVKTGDTERMLERSSLRVSSREGQLIGCMIILRDVTEEHQVAQTRELLTETLVHDLRSPLSAVLGGLDMALEDIEGAEHTLTLYSLQALDVSRRSARRVLGLVEALLDISRMQSGVTDLSILPVDLSDLAGSLLGDYQIQARDFSLNLQAQIPDDLPLVCIDANKISRVLSNLLDNALKFTPEGGQVCLSITQEGDHVLVRVSDTGQGIPAEYREKIFDRFMQVPGQRSRRRGSGLGLTFCKLVVEAHGGQIWVDAPPEGGSIFCFTLPIHQSKSKDPCQSNTGVL